MTRPTPRSRLRRTVVGAFRFGGVTMLFAAAAVYLCYRADRAVLRVLATRIVEGIDAQDEQVRAVNSWVHWHGGFVANEQLFMFPQLRATPLQVVDEGGDCADKSRLVVALLSELSIPATSAMCFDPATGEAVHTVVEAGLGADGYMVVDPSFDLFFPKGEPGKYFGLLELRRDSTILPSRLHEITSSRDYWMRVNGYRQDSSVYDFASTFNWRKNFLTNAAYSALHELIGENVHRVRRPRVLEEPKLMIATAAALGGIGLLSGSVLLAGRTKRCAVMDAGLKSAPLRQAAETGDDRRCPLSIGQDRHLLETL